MHTLETPRLLLRPFTLHDVDDYNRLIHSDPDVMRYLPGGQPLPRERSIGTLMYFIDHGHLHGFSFWAVSDLQTGALMGHAGLHRLSHGTTEVGYSLAREHWGKGYATEAARACLAYGFERVGLAEIIALAFAENTPSRRVMERLGMAYIGVTDQYYNTELVLYRLSREQFQRREADFRVLE